MQSTSHRQDFTDYNSGTTQSTLLSPAQREYTSDAVKAQRINVTKKQLKDLAGGIKDDMEKIINIYFDEQYDKQVGDAGFIALENGLVALIPGFEVFAIIGASISSIMEIVEDSNLSKKQTAALSKLDDIFENFDQKVDDDPLYL